MTTDEMARLAKAEAQMQALMQRQDKLEAHLAKLLEALRFIAHMDNEENQWDAVTKFHGVRAVARMALLDKQ